ncbi:hypothetical protein B0H14DRAFT_3652781 [Mycena olivaceomarginata]|nr:hypothetical protein B0H14DRAFT_3652781 [Mycena olivaceomarginata]
MATAKDPYSLLRQRPEIFAKTYEELWRLPLFSRHVSEQDLKTTTGILSTRSVLRPAKPSGAGSDPLHRSNSSGTAVLNGGVSCDNITHAEFSSLDPALHGTDNISPGGSVFQKFHVPTMPETRNDGEGTVFQQSLIPVALETEDVLTDVTTDQGVPAIEMSDTGYHSCGEVPKSLIPMMLLSEHVFLLTLAKRWKEPPLSYYTMVAEKAATLLQRLAEWPTSLAHDPTFAVPNYEEFPTSSFVVEDLLAMDRPLIHYQELGAQDGLVVTPANVLASHIVLELAKPGVPALAYSKESFADARRQGTKLAEIKTWRIVDPEHLKTKKWPEFLWFRL